MISLERLALEQEEIIARQSAIISGLLRELSQFRALDAEEQALAASVTAKEEGNDNA
jgi:hypothetical protein